MKNSIVIHNYYTLSRGIEPSDSDWKRTLATANYLSDNGYSNAEILRILCLCNKDKIEGADLPEILWEGSLLEKNKFYYSNLFHIVSKPPTWNPTTFKEEVSPFYLEMKIKFTIEDLLTYYYDKCRVPLSLQEEIRDKKAFEFLLTKYKKFNNVPAIDYVIALINEASNDVEKELFLSVFEIENYKEQVIKNFEEIYTSSVFEKANQIIWRS